MSDCLLGIDVGSSAVKACLVDAASRRRLAHATEPAAEMAIDAPRPGWAEQHPDLWWRNVVAATARAVDEAGVAADAVGAIGIAYQMHGLVLVDDRHEVIRPAIIWCDSRAVDSGRKLAAAAGRDRCDRRLLNQPGNFTAAKLLWVHDHEPDLFARVHRMLLPGDAIALRMTGAASTTASGLSEGTLWDFVDDEPATFVLAEAGVDPSVIAPLVPTFGDQGRLTTPAAEELGLRPGIPIAYRAGDQPNNALSLGALEPGQVAAAAGTSGVVYGVAGAAVRDPEARVNAFAHVNHSAAAPRLGVLLCVNGTGALYAWLRRELAGNLSYASMNELAAGVEVGSEGLTVLPFGNGAERLLANRDIGARFVGLDFRRHGRAHLLRAAQEGIAAALTHGMRAMQELGIDVTRIRAGRTNLFLSAGFAEALACMTGTSIELVDTDGAQGAALAAGVGAGMYESPRAAFDEVPPVAVIEPAADRVDAYAELYGRWRDALNREELTIPCP